MGWLEDYLANSASQRNALLTAAKTGGTLAPDPGDNAPQSPGPAGVTGNPLRRRDAAIQVALGKGVARRQVGGQPVDSPYDRYMVRRGGQLLEAHDYGDHNVKYLKRKNPALLEAAGRLAFLRQSPNQAGAQAYGQEIAGMDPAEQERIRYLLGA